MTFAQILVSLGIVLNLADVATDKEGQGGAVFGGNGFLTTLDAKLPDVKLPVLDTRINIGGWLIIIGLLLVIMKKMR